MTDPKQPPDNVRAAALLEGATISRRRFLEMAGALAAIPLVGQAQATDTIIHRTIPSSGQPLPVVGMGSYITFDIDGDAEQLTQRIEVLRAFFAAGGQMIDSSPMYDSSEETLGKALRALGPTPELFSATKVWHFFTEAGNQQMIRSRELWGEPGFDLMQVHNLVNWFDHLQSIRRDRDAGLVRYVGITTSHGRMHDEVRDLLRKESLDFVQFTYNILDREAEQRLLPLAADREVAVIINRPFRRGGLIRRFEDKPLPDWAAEIGCETWPQFLLKFVVSHPAVTCVIPATSRVEHMRENMVALRGSLPDERMREEMVRYAERI
jgi:diketogulonate reductase-like aldo/keto reductase